MTDRFSLRIESGARASEVISLTHSPFLIGRNPDCDLNLTDSSVSGRHAELRQEGGRVHLHDLGSTNGTRIGRLKVGEAELENDLTFSLGDVKITLISASADVPTPAPSRVATSAVQEGANDELELEWDEPSNTPAAPAAKPVSKSSPKTASPQPAGAESPIGGADSFAQASAQTKIQERQDSGLGGDEFLGEANSIRADHLAKAGRRSPLPLIILGVSLLAAGAAFYLWSRKGAEEDVKPKVAIIEGDILKGSGGFESEEGWQPREEWSSSFRRARSASANGQSGILAELATGERAQHVSDPTGLGTLATYSISAKVRVIDQAWALIGLRFEVSGDQPGRPEPTTAFGPVLRAGEGFQDWTWSGAVPEGYDIARVVVTAHAPGERSEEDEEPTLVGEVAVDQVVLLSEGKAQPSAQLDEVHADAIGDPSTALVIHKIDRLLLTGVQVLDGKGGTQKPLSVAASTYGFELVAAGLAAPHWILTASPQLVEGGLASMGSEGYLARRLEFESEGVTDLVLGTGSDLVRVVLGGSCRVTGRSVGGSYRFVVQGIPGGKVLIKTRFGDDFKTALTLASAAELATQQGRVGDALASWKELLDRYPYEAKDVAKADAARTVLLREGFDAVKVLEADLERARFFSLRKGFEDCLSRAQALGERYSGSELAEPVAAVVASIQTDLGGFDQSNSADGGHMDVLMEVLSSQGAAELVAGLKASSDRQDPSPNATDGGE